MFGDQGALLPLVCSRPAHVANQVNQAVAFGDVGVELVERIAAEILEVLLHLHRNVLSGEVAAELIPISSEFVGNGRKEDADRHGARSVGAPSCHIAAKRNTAGRRCTAKSQELRHWRAYEARHK
jgi:hypothetical protein